MSSHTDRTSEPLECVGTELSLADLRLLFDSANDVLIKSSSLPFHPKKTPMRSQFLAFAAALFAGVAGANTLTEGLLRGQVNVTMSDGNVDGCGVTVLALETGNGATGKLRVFNGSFVLYTLGTGLVKGRASEVEAKLVLQQPGGALNQLKISPTEHFWFKAQDKPSTTLIEGQKHFKSDDPGYLLYATKFDAIFGLLDAVIERKPIQVGMKIKGRGVGEVLYGVVQMSDADTDQLVQCMAEWGEAVKKKHGLK